MRILFFLFFFIYCFCVISQNTPSEYYFSNDNKILLRGGADIIEGLYSEIYVDTIFLYFNQDNYWEQMLDNYCDKINIDADMIYKGEYFNRSLC